LKSGGTKNEHCLGPWTGTSEELKEADLMERREECSEWLILPSNEQFKELLKMDYKLMLNINKWSLLLAFRMGKRMNLLFNFHHKKTRSNKEARMPLWRTSSRLE